MESANPWIETGAWIGRQQAFAVIATKCSGAQALALKQMKESRAFEQLGLTWEEFCLQHAGFSRVHADYLIRQHEEFGEAYFRLSEIARISPETYREIAEHVQNDALEFEGESIPLSAENAPRIRAAVQRLREQVRAARSGNLPPAPGIIDLRIAIDALFDRVARIAARPLPADQFAGYRGLAVYAKDRWSQFAGQFQQLL